MTPAEVEGSSTLKPEKQGAIKQRVQQWDSELQSAGGDSAERAFGLGCGIGILPVFGILGLLWILRSINLILFLILLVIALLALTGLGMLAAYRARANTMERLFQRRIVLELDQLLEQQQVTRAQVYSLAVDTLSKDSPLIPLLNLNDTNPARLENPRENETEDGENG